MKLAIGAGSGGGISGISTTGAGLRALGAFALAARPAAFRRAGLATRWSEHGLIAPFPAELGQGAWLFAE